MWGDMEHGRHKLLRLTQNLHSTVLGYNYFWSCAHSNSICSYFVQEASLCRCLIVRSSDMDIHTFLWIIIICGVLCEKIHTLTDPHILPYSQFLCSLHDQLPQLLVIGRSHSRETWPKPERGILEIFPVCLLYIPGVIWANERVAASHAS